MNERLSEVILKKLVSQRRLKQRVRDEMEELFNKVKSQIQIVTKESGLDIKKANDIMSKYN